MYDTIWLCKLIAMHFGLIVIPIALILKIYHFETLNITYINMYVMHIVTVNSISKPLFFVFQLFCRMIWMVICVIFWLHLSHTKNKNLSN